MRYVRTWVGVGALLVFAGSAAAQPDTFSGVSPVSPVSPVIQGNPGTFGTGAPVPLPQTAPQPVRSLPPPEEHVVKELPGPHGLGALHPPEDKHHGHNEIPGHLTAIVPEHGGFYTGAEFLLMRPRNSDMDSTFHSAGGLATTGPIDSIRYDVGTGLRFDAGYLYNGGKWETAFSYTYFNGGSENTTTSAAAGVSLLPTLTRPGLTDRVLTTSDTVDLDYQLFDLVAGRRFVIEDNFAVRAIAGFRFADIRQTLNVFYDGGDARLAAVRTRSRLQGFGPMVGGEGTLAGPRGFHLYGRAYGGFMSGNSTNSLLETNDNGATTYVNTRYDVRKVVPFGSVAIGGGWQYRSIAMRAGYEIQHWQGIFERPRFVDDVSQGKVITRPANLCLEGLFLQVSVIY